MSETLRSKYRAALVSVSGVALLGVLGACGAAEPEAQPTTEPTQTVTVARPTPTLTATPTPTPTSTPAEDFDIDPEGDNITAQIEVTDGDQAREDTVKILRQISESENNDKTVTITGRSDGRVVLLLNYDPSVYTRLNYDAPAITEGVWDVSEDAPRLVDPSLEQS